MGENDTKVERIGFISIAKSVVIFRIYRTKDLWHNSLLFLLQSCSRRRKRQALNGPKGSKRTLTFGSTRKSAASGSGKPSRSSGSIGSSSSWSSSTPAQSLWNTTVNPNGLQSSYVSEYKPFSSSLQWPQILHSQGRLKHVWVWISHESKTHCIFTFSLILFLVACEQVIFAEMMMTQFVHDWRIKFALPPLNHKQKRKMGII